METRTLSCKNCAAPLEVPLGDVETICDFCGSRLRFVPALEELEIVRTREEMKYRERVAVQKAILERRLQAEEGEKWRRAAARVAITALPVVGDAAGRALFGAAVRRSGGCLGCGCSGLVLALVVLVAALAGSFGR